MKKLLLILPLALLAACGEEPAPAPEPTPEAPPLATEGLPAPNQEIFSEAFAEACPDAEPVSTAVCRRTGLGSPDFVCDYGLGEDEYRRNSAVLTAQDGEWVIADTSVCAAPGE